MDFETAIAYATVMAARGRRVWQVGGSDVAGWLAVPASEGDAPGPRETPPDYVARDALRFIVYPSGLWLSVARVPWVWWFAEERKYRLGNAEQASVYCDRRPQSCVAVPPEFLHGCQVREDGGPGLYRFVTAVSFPHWCGV